MPRRRSADITVLPHCRPLTHEQVSAYVRELQTLLRLSDWTIKVNLTEPAKDEALADITPFPYQQRAELRLGEGFWALSHDDARQTLCHELLHCKLFHIHQVVEEMLTEVTSAKAAQLAMVAINGEIERVVDDLADVTAPFMPSWPTSPAE